MGSPFPGMDPYLEHPGLWPGFHHRLIVALADDIGPRVAPGYYVSVEEWVYIAGDDDRRRPDLAVLRETPAVHYPVASTLSPDVPRRVRVPLPGLEHQVYLDIRDATNGELITVVELLSPANKHAGPGHQAYLQKRAAILRSSAHLVEIDLLRNGQPMPVEPPHPPGRYSILVSRADRRPEAECYTFSVRDHIPLFPLPLRSGDDGPPVDLRACIDHVYERGSYTRRIDYRAEPSPPLAPEDAAWMRSILPAVGEES